MTYDQALSGRLGQRSAIENPGIRLVTATTDVEAPYHGQLIYVAGVGVYVYDAIAVTWHIAIPPTHVNEMGYAEITANSAANTSSSAMDVTGLSIAVTVTTRPIFVEAQALLFHTTGTGSDYKIMYIQEGSTVLGQYVVMDLDNNIYDTGRVGVRLSPTPGAHTYKVTIASSLATRGCQIFASSTAPAWIRVTEG